MFKNNIIITFYYLKATVKLYSKGFKNNQMSLDFILSIRKFSMLPAQNGKIYVNNNFIDGTY